MPGPGRMLIGLGAPAASSLGAGGSIYLSRTSGTMTTGFRSSWKSRQDIGWKFQGSRPLTYFTLLRQDTEEEFWPELYGS